MNVNTGILESQANNANSALFPINDIRQHAVAVQHHAADASTLLDLAAEKLAGMTCHSAADRRAFAGIDCLMRSARRALGEIDEAGAAVSLVLEDVGMAVEGGAL